MGPATPSELRAMQEAVRGAMEDGAFGIASALIYPPGNFASTDELTALARAMAPFGGVYITHMRSEADRLLEAIDEAITIGSQSGVPVEIYHLKAAGQRNWDKAELAVAKIDSARALWVWMFRPTCIPTRPVVLGSRPAFLPWTAADGKLLDNLSDPSRASSNPCRDRSG